MSIFDDIDRIAEQRMRQRKQEEDRIRLREARQRASFLDQARKDLDEINEKLKNATYYEYEEEVRKLERKYHYYIIFGIHWFDYRPLYIYIISYKGKSV